MAGLVAGKRIVVTGASRGLGRAFARALAAEGALVVVNGTNADRLAETRAEIESAGGRVASVLGSVADYDVCGRIIERCVSEFGGLDVLVNNAGTVRDRTLLRMTPEDFDEVVAVNLRGTWACSQHAARAMKDTGGHILNIVSASAFTGPIGQTNYSAAKAGVVAMTRNWCFELARYGIRANALWPLASTDMTQVIVERAREQAEARGEPAPKPADLGLGDPDEIARLVVFLASDAAARLNGQVVGFNGRKLALWTHPREINIEEREHWSLEEIARDFFATAGRDLQPIYKASKRV